MEAEPPGHAFPGGAWEREVKHSKNLAESILVHRIRNFAPESPENPSGKGVSGQKRVFIALLKRNLYGL